MFRYGIFGSVHFVLMACIDPPTGVQLRSKDPTTPPLPSLHAQGAQCKNVLPREGLHDDRWGNMQNNPA